ncbi:MAG TPA: GrpB family protein [Mucilaginibacter sp.]|jgi:GrpB-like predicted nucleotidyltransferase (UPF0157 family)
MNSNQETWPQWATEEIVIEEYNPVWPLLASILIRELKTLYRFENESFEHIGSTAVPDLAAKPIIDIMIAVDNYDDIDAIKFALESENWNLIPPDLMGKDYQRTFVKVVNDKRFGHFHLILNKDGEAKRHIAFRDALRQNPSLANEYAKLKVELAEKFKNDREAYTDAKTEFISRITPII